MSNIATGRATFSDRNRREFLRIAGFSGAALVASACAPVVTGPSQGPAGSTTGAGSAPSSDSGWQRAWDDLVSRAKKEGKLAFNVTNNTASYQGVLEGWKKAFPEIEMELTTFSSGSLWLPKALQERNAGIHTWDATHLAASFGFQSALPEGLFEPLRPVLLRPDVAQDEHWLGGLDSCWVDNEKRWGFTPHWDLTGRIWINTDLVDESKIKSVKDLLDPKWKGRLIFADPRNNGNSYLPMTVIRLNMGDEVIKQLLVDQQPAISRDIRQITEALVRGQYAMGFGVSLPFVEEFQAQGLGRNIKEVPLAEATAPSVTQPLWLLKGAPHPNAARVFINWLLSKEGQTLYSQSTRYNSRRRDVAPVNPATNPDPGKKYPFIMGQEATINEQTKLQELAVKLLG